MAKKDVKDEQVQLDKISAQIKEKRKEVDEFDNYMKIELDKIDIARKEIGALRQKYITDCDELNLKIDKYETDKKGLDTELEGIAVKRAGLDRLALASDARLKLAESKELANKVKEQNIVKLQSTSDTTNVELKKELEGKLVNIDELVKLRQKELIKSRVQLEALQEERQSIVGAKQKYEDLVKEVEATKGQLSAQLNKSKDAEQECRKISVELKNREQNCNSREQEIKDNQIELDAKWAKVNRKIEIMGFKDELAQDKEV